MAEGSLVVGERLSIGAVLQRSYRILLGNLSSLFVVALVTSSLSFAFFEVLGLYAEPLLVEAGEPWFYLIAVTLPAMVVDAALSAIATGVIVYGVLCELRGRPVGLREMFRHSLPVLWPVALLGLVTTFTFLVGLALLVVPGLILGVWFWVAIPVAVVERRGLRACLARSRELTAGSRWPIFALLLFSLASMAGFVYGISFVVDYENAFWRSLFSDVGGTGLLVAFWSVVSAVTYADLKRIKEGGDVDEVAEVFD